MASLEVYDAIRSALDPNLGGAWTSTKLEWPNEPFTLPVDDQGNQLPYVSVMMTGTLYGQESIGVPVQADNRWDEEGILWLHVYVAVGAGERTQRQYCKQLADIFRGLTLLSDSLEFRDASLGIGEMGNEQGSLWRTSVSIEWRRMDA